MSKQFNKGLVGVVATINGGWCGQQAITAMCGQTYEAVEAGRVVVTGEPIRGHPIDWPTIRSVAKFFGRTEVFSHDPKERPTLTAFKRDKPVWLEPCWGIIHLAGRRAKENGHAILVRSDWYWDFTSDPKGSPLRESKYMRRRVKQAVFYADEDERTRLDNHAGELGQAIFRETQRIGLANFRLIDCLCERERIVKLLADPGGLDE